MTRNELASNIAQLANNEELVSIMQYAYKHKMSRTWAQNKLTKENGWIKVIIDNRNYYLKDK